MYAVVTFLPNDKDTEVTSDVVSINWLLAKNTKTFWPNFSKRGNTDKRSKLILSLAEPDKSWPIYDVNFVTAMARKAANLQNDEDRTVGTEVSDEDHRRKRKKNSRYLSESSEDECNLNDNVKKISKSNQSPLSESENEEIQEDLKTKVVVLLSKRDNRKPQVSENKKGSMVLTSKNVIKTLHSGKDCSVNLNNIIENHSRYTECKLTSAVSLATTEAKTSMSFPNTSASLLQVHRQYDDVNKVKEQVLSEIVQEENRQEINVATDNEEYETISQILNHPTYLSNEQRQTIISVKDQPTTIPSGKHSKENRSSDANSINFLEKSVSPSQHESSSDNTIAAIKKVKTELLQEISSKLDFVMMNTTKILIYLAPEESLLLRPDNLPPLPLKSVDEYDKFEEFLNDSTSFSTVVQYFAGRTISEGNDWQNATYLVSKLLISNKLGRVISWAGTKDTKIALANSKIMEAVYCAVLKNHPKSNLKMVKSKIQRWLYTGNQRKI